jgi:hypothetical protein
MHPTTWFFFFLLIHFSVELICTIRETIRVGCRIRRWFWFDVGYSFDNFTDYWYRSEFLYRIWFLCCLATFMPYSDVNNMSFHWAQVRNVSIKEMLREGL